MQKLLLLIVRRAPPALQDVQVTFKFKPIKLRRNRSLPDSSHGQSMSRSCFHAAVQRSTVHHRLQPTANSVYVEMEAFYKRASGRNARRRPGTRCKVQSRGRRRTNSRWLLHSIGCGGAPCIVRAIIRVAPKGRRLDPAAAFPPRRLLQNLRGASRDLLARHCLRLSCPRPPHPLQRFNQCFP